jgi:hypothetical protein
VKHWPDLQVLPRCVKAQLTSVPAGSHVERRDLATIQCLGPFGIVSRSQRSATSKAAYWWPAENPALRRRGHSPDTQDQGKTQSMSPFVRWNRRARKWDGSPSSGCRMVALARPKPHVPLQKPGATRRFRQRTSIRLRQNLDAESRSTYPAKAAVLP